MPSLTQLPKHQHDFTDEAFIEEFDLQRSSLKPLRLAYDAEDMDRAKDELVHYFKTRKKPAWIADLRDGRRGYMPPLRPLTMKEDRAETLRLADRLLANEFELGPGLVLRFNKNLNWVRPDTCDIGIPGNGFRVGRYFHTLAAAHALTRKPVYATKFEEIARRWAQDWPFATDANFHKDTLLFGTDRNYKTLPTGNRLISWLSCIYSGIIFDSHVPVETAFQFIKGLWFTASHYLVFRRARYRSGNHHVMRCGTIPGVMGIMFPETPRFYPLVDLSRRTLTAHVRKSFLPDGGYEERSTSYTCATLGMFLKPLLLARRNQIQLMSKDEKATLRRCAESLAMLCTPKGFPAPVGDGGNNNPDSFSALLYRMNEVYSSRRIATVAANLDLNRFVPAESRFACENPVSLPLSARYPAAGYAVMRTGWSVKDSIISVSIPDGTNELPGHAHDDALSVDLVVRGVSIISCPSSELYISVNAKKYRGTAARGYPYSMEAHNVVLVGGMSLQSPESLGDSWGTTTPAVTSELKKTRGVTSINASHTGYPNTTVERMVNASGTTWIIDDRVTGPGQIKHLLRWHFDYRVEVLETGTDETGISFVAEKDDVRLTIDVECPSPVKAKLYRNAKWMRPAINHRDEQFPWVLDVRFGGSGDDRITTRFVE